MRTGKKSAEAEVAKKRSNVRGAKGRRSKTKLERGLKGKLRRDLKSKGTTTAVVTWRVQRAEAMESGRA